MKFISFEVVMIFHAVIVCWCSFKAFSTYVIRKFQHFIRSDWWECLSTSKVDGTQWGVTECESLHHFTISTFHHSTYTFYRDIWVRSMLIMFNEFGLSTYVITDKSWTCGSHDSRTSNTLINYIDLCFIDTLKHLYMSTLGCDCCACVCPFWCISGSVVLKHQWDPNQ